MSELLSLHYPKWSKCFLASPHLFKKETLPLAYNQLLCLGGTFALTAAEGKQTPEAACLEDCHI